VPFSFKAKIYKVGINPCVKVPAGITAKMKVIKGYIPVKGKILDHPFEQTLCPVKNDLYRLYVNGPMMKGANVKVGQTVSFTIEQADKQKDSDIPMPALFKKKLKENKLLATFLQEAPYRQKEVLRYLNNLKTEVSLLKNIDKLILVMKGKASLPFYKKKN
jgi:hypothetical protein